jgi:FMN phosphatase YigB (HAD superfamily)
MMKTADLVIMLDVDNTLLDNDRAKRDMDTALEQILGIPASDRLWALYEEVRSETSVVDFPLTLARFREEYTDTDRLEEIETLLNTFPYERYVYPRVPETLAHLWMLGTPVIVSDGDLVFQAYKIRSSGLAEAVRGNVLIFDHKDEHLDEIQDRYPARQYVMVDDKDGILDKMKRACGGEVVTVHVCQGKYAELPDVPPTPDIEIDRISDLLRFTAADFHRRGG